MTERKAGRKNAGSAINDEPAIIGDGNDDDLYYEICSEIFEGVDRVESQFGRQVVVDVVDAEFERTKKIQAYRTKEKRIIDSNNKMGGFPFQEASIVVDSQTCKFAFNMYQQNDPRMRGNMLYAAYWQELRKHMVNKEKYLNSKALFVDVRNRLEGVFDFMSCIENKTYGKKAVMDVFDVEVERDERIDKFRTGHLHTDGPFGVHVDEPLGMKELRTTIFIYELYDPNEPRLADNPVYEQYWRELRDSRVTEDDYLAAKKEIRRHWTRVYASSEHLTKPRRQETE